ncbi:MULTISPECIES: DUF3566 domain-containing protein [unclassified Aeromicrobium]|uniref:DUF3566 domain-containing protein n=1 Tax=unclassified Aeromicrobium TaxID=2633570 RepID=UPI00288B87D7|nr:MULTISPECIES: DUF3566 domain-containing protein [unclassified Aeromicrobium]
MSDPQKPEDRAPRPGAGDAARTQQIPRLGRDGKPVRSQKTVADALREARQSPEEPAKNESNGTARRPAGPARPAASGRSSSSSSSSESSAAKPASKTPAAKPTEKPTDKAAPRDKAAPGAPRSGAASAAAKRAETKKAAEAKKTSQSPRTPESTPQKPAASGASTATSSTSSRSSTPTAGDYARTTRQSPDSTAVIPAVKDDAPSATSPAPAASAASTSGRQARLRLTHVEPWSVTRLAFVVSVALMIVSVVAVTIFWVVLDLTGIWDQLNGTVTNVLSDSEGSFDLTDYLGLGRLVGLTLVFSAINVVLMTAIATVAAHLYNLAAQLLGGIEVTFTDS